jgi:two-component sensor histidine kinase
MTEDESPMRVCLEEPSDSLRRLERDRKQTETIELHNLFTQDLTASGSFDIRGDIWATTFGKLLQALPIPCLLVDECERVVAANQATARVSPEYETAVGAAFHTLFPSSEASDRAKQNLERLLSDRKPIVTEDLLQVGGNRIWGRLTFRSIRIIDQRYILVLMEDLTIEKKRLLLLEKQKTELVRINDDLKREIARREQAESQLKASLADKQVLLREVHHRVKNNLAVISSLLNLQAGHVTDPATRQVFSDTQARVRSIALAHEMLYQSPGLSEVGVKDYISRLIDCLTASMGTLGGDVQVIQEIEDCRLWIDETIPIGFLVTELFSNCLKHAFTGRRGGEIRISFRSADQADRELAVADNGIGFPDYVDPERSGSLGLELVGIYVKQLRGRFEIERKHGTQVRVTFPDPKRR